MHPISYEPKALTKQCKLPKVCLPLTWLARPAQVRGEVEGVEVQVRVDLKHSAARSCQHLKL